MTKDTFKTLVKKQKLKIISDDFSQHCGSEEYYKTFFPELYYTSGMADVAETLQAHWLIDAIVSYAPTTRRHEIVFWTLTTFHEKALLECRLDSDQKAFIEQFIEYTDFPEGIFKIFQSNGVIYLPSEH